MSKYRNVHQYVLNMAGILTLSWLIPYTCTLVQGNSLFMFIWYGMVGEHCFTTSLVYLALVEYCQAICRKVHSLVNWLFQRRHISQNFCWARSWHRFRYSSWCGSIHLKRTTINQFKDWKHYGPLQAPFRLRFRELLAQWLAGITNNLLNPSHNIYKH